MRTLQQFCGVWFLLFAFFCFLPSDVQSQTTNQFKIAEITGYFGSRFTSVECYVSRSVLEKQPYWNPLSGQLLLTPNKACLLALHAVKENFPTVDDWRVENVLMFHLNASDAQEIRGAENIWYYEIELAPTDPKMANSLDGLESDHLLTQIVLLVGTVVKAEKLKSEEN